MMKHMVDNIAFKTGEVSVSTIDLTETGFGSAIETCIFYPGGDSEVVATYPNAEEAAAGHKAFCNQDVIRFVRRSMVDREWCDCEETAVEKAIAQHEQSLMGIMYDKSFGE